uniref:Uncharacterized protein n=1 Tax=Anguilla anguilla TaxID=7936 RepID=A0A0E9XB72_ANGAN
MNIHQSGPGLECSVLKQQKWCEMKCVCCPGSGVGTPQWKRCLRFIISYTGFEL